ncbi:MAG: TIGR00282 family metallophosphoesterase [Planctomycetota bacterium]
MRVLHIGDIVGRPGRRIVQLALAGLRARHGLDFIVANGENSADGSGITPDNFKQLRQAGVDCVTLGDHIYRRRQIIPVMAGEPRILKPANYPDASPGHGWVVVPPEEGVPVPVAVVSLIGRVFMKPVDCPFAAADRVLAEIPSEVKVILVDFHAEATSDKQLMGRFLDGRVSSVLGTHTHVPTADEQILPGGTAFQCDIGMTGPHDSILGRRIDAVMHTTTTFSPMIFDVATDDVRLTGTLVEIDPNSGKATHIERLQVTEQEAKELANATPASDGLT